MVFPVLKCRINTNIKQETDLIEAVTRLYMVLYGARIQVAEGQGFIPERFTEPWK